MWRSISIGSDMPSLPEVYSRLSLPESYVRR